MIPISPAHAGFDLAGRTGCKHRTPPVLEAIDVFRMNGRGPAPVPGLIPREARVSSQRWLRNSADPSGRAAHTIAGIVSINSKLLIDDLAFLERSLQRISRADGVLGSPA